MGLDPLDLKFGKKPPISSPFDRDSYDKASDLLLYLQANSHGLGQMETEAQP